WSAGGVESVWIDLSADLPDKKRNGRLLPSSGGTGSKLNAASKRFREKKRLSIFATNDHTLPSCPVAVITSMKPTRPESANAPHSNPTRIRIAAIRTTVRFAAGPARAINAARLGY